MKIVSNIFSHYKGEVTELEYVGENPKNRNYSVWMDSDKEIVQVLNADLSTKHFYSDKKFDMMVKAREWHKRQVALFDLYFSNNGR